MRAPSFWNIKHGRDAAFFLRTLLFPVSIIYNYITQSKIKNAKPFDCGIPVISIGNLTLGGTGKTPIAAKIREYLNQNYGKTAIISRGYGGSMKDATKVVNHTAQEVGDEPLMLSKTGDVYIARDRTQAAKLAINDNIKAIILDDGHQNPSLLKTLSIIIIDGNTAFGNGFIFPAGPLREKPEIGLKRADVIIWIGDKTNISELKTELPIYFANIKPIKRQYNGKYLAFCGIGNPNKFHNTIKELGIDLIDLIPFADHHYYTDKEISELFEHAKSQNAKLLTTDKDYARLDEKFQQNIETISIEIEFENENALSEILSNIK